MRIYIVLFLVFGLSRFSLPAQTYYVALNGSDLNPGTLAAPFRTLNKAIGLVKPGETIFLRGGIYPLSASVIITSSGKPDAIIALHAYPGERPVLDGFGMPLSASYRGFRLKGSYWHVKGLDIRGAGHNGMLIEGGHHNLIEQCAFYRNRDSGLQLSAGASHNTIINCDSYLNADPPDYGDADGFAPKLDVGSENYFYGCRAWKNSDDDWDGYLRGANHVSNRIENCWSFENGYLEDGTDPGPQANGNGFKMGGSDDKSLSHTFTLKHCLAFKNKVKGFDQNSNKGSMFLYNCTGYSNKGPNFQINQEVDPGMEIVVKNCIDLAGSPKIAAFAEQARNSWMPPLTAKPVDFLSLDDDAAYGPRKADGSLPDMAFMHLAPNSGLINAGIDVGLPFNGPAPDLGCFETNITSASGYLFLNNFFLSPNPLRTAGELGFQLDQSVHCQILLFDSAGRLAQTLADREFKAGEQHLPISPNGLAPGVYYLKIRCSRRGKITAQAMKAVVISPE
ncbi:MAG: right-handed parallel beta-helix repeat-containing protein [Haliscomenobacter sp.]|nr:right-handed parallel beta-helix repeat-containing protein [Haliscomenobacter sp.]